MVTHNNNNSKKWRFLGTIDQTSQVASIIRKYKKRKRIILMFTPQFSEFIISHHTHMWTKWIKTTTTIIKPKWHISFKESELNIPF